MDNIPKNIGYSEERVMFRKSGEMNTITIKKAPFLKRVRNILFYRFWVSFTLIFIGACIYFIIEDKTILLALLCFVPGSYFIIYGMVLLFLDRYGFAFDSQILADHINIEIINPKFRKTEKFPYHGVKIIQEPENTKHTRFSIKIRRKSKNQKSKMLFKTIGLSESDVKLIKKFADSNKIAYQISFGDYTPGEYGETFDYN